MIYIAKSQSKWGKADNPNDARRNAGIELREDHFIWEHDDPDIIVTRNEGPQGEISNAFLYGYEYHEPRILSQWKDGKRIDRVVEAPIPLGPPRDISDADFEL